MSSTYPRATSLSPSSSILSLGRQGMGNLYCTSQDTEDVQYGYSETRSESEMRRRMLGPMVSGYGPPGSGIGRLTNGNPSEDGYSSSDATVTAIRTNRSRLRAIPSGVVPMQRRRQEDAYNPIDPLTAIDAVKASSNDRGHYANESAGTANRPKQSSRASGDQAIRSKGELFNRNSFLMHQDFTPVRPKPRESESHIHQETYPKTAGKSLDPTVYIPRSFSLDDVMDYPLSADVLRFTRTGVDLANLVSPATDPTIGEAASNINVRKARGIPRIESQNHAGYGARMEHGSEQSFARRRLSEGSSSLVRVSQRPSIQRNTSSDISNRTRPSQRDTSESEGASSPGDWDGPLFSAGSSAFRTLSGGGNMSTGRTSMPDSAWPASPFSEDDRHLSAAQSGTSLRPQAPPPARDGTVLPALLLGLRLLAVVPAVAGSVNLLWQVAQSGTTDTRQLADHFAALPWVCFPCVRRRYASRPDSSLLRTGYLDRCFLFRADLGIDSTLAGTLRSCSDIIANGLASVAVLALHLLYTSICRCSRHVAGMDSRLHDNSLFAIDSDLGYEQCPRPYTQDAAAAEGIPSCLIFRRRGRHGIVQAQE